MLFGLILAFPLVLPLILTSKKRRKTVLQRLGISSLPVRKPSGKNAAAELHPIWIHALSVGETFASVELVKKIKEYNPDRKLFFSVSTATGFDEAEKRLTNDVDCIFFYPYDFLFSVRKMVRRVSPSLFVLVESDIWPTFLLELKKRNIPAVLVNARLSNSSFVGYKRLSWIITPVLNSFAAICVQSVNQANRFAEIGVKPEKLFVTGNMKFDRKADQVSRENIVSIRQSLGIQENKKVFLAGSTHPGEENILFHSFLSLKPTCSDLVLIVVPRNPDRSDEVCRLALESGLLVKKMSQDKPDFPNVVVVDTMGFLGKLYAVADAAFVGGSLVPFGGHNPLEPAAFAKPIMFGPYMSDFPEISKMMLGAEGAVEVTTAEDIDRAVRDFLTDPIKARRFGSNAFEVFKANQGAVERTLAVIKKIKTDQHV